MRIMWTSRHATFATLLVILIAGCGSGLGAGGGQLQIVAAENTLGSVAGQLAGSRATVRSIIVDPAQDPHSYEPTANDARALATARLAIFNGIGYDGWASKLLAANPEPTRTTLDVGKVLGLGEGQNPHVWYSPVYVARIATAITEALARLEPRDAGYFARQRREFERRALALYHALIARIRRSYAGTSVGASESIFAPLAGALGLRVITPNSFLKAVSEGTDLTAQDKLSVERQVSGHQIKVWVYNSQNATPEVQHLNALARAAGIPIVSVTETLSPAHATFQQWQVGQLLRLEQALARSRRR